MFFVVCFEVLWCVCFLLFWFAVFTLFAFQVSNLFFRIAVGAATCSAVVKIEYGLPLYRHDERSRGAKKRTRHKYMPNGSQCAFHSSLLVLCTVIDLGSERVTSVFDSLDRGN